MGGVGLIFTPVLVRRLLRPSSRVWAYDWHFLDSQLLQTVQLGGVARLRLPTRPLHPTAPSNHPPPPPTPPPSHPPNPLYMQSVILQWL